MLFSRFVRNRPTASCGKNTDSTLLEGQSHFKTNFTDTGVLHLNRDTTTESLRTMFSQYGELEDAVVTTDRASGKSKGYGFITYRFAASAAAAVAEPEKQLDVSTPSSSPLFADLAA